jgi:hypothetical protein
VSEDGSCVVTKPAGTGGEVTEATVKEQLLYEIGDPRRYISPDVTVSFLTLTVEELGSDRVRVSGARGGPAPETLKVSATYRDGYWAAGTLTIIGHEARAKAERCGKLVLSRVHEAGHELRESVLEYLEGENRTLLRIAVAAESSAAVERFSRELMPLITAGPQGTTGYSDGRPRVHPQFRYWPCLIRRDSVTSHVETMTTSGTTPTSTPAPLAKPKPVSLPHSKTAPTAQPDPPKVLRDLARARSGDKGTSSNIGVIARRPGGYECLQAILTADRVAEFFQDIGVDEVVRYELPNLGALNFVLKGILSSPLRTDAQGKALGQMLLEMPLS